MTDINALKAHNAARWRHAVPTRDFRSVAKRLVAAKDRYQAVSLRTGVPWFLIAVIHEREASQLWDTQLGQGDPLNRVSRHVPRGRGPFKTWEEGAFDALVNCPPYAAKWSDWTAGGALTLLEEYNGLGYAAKGIPSPYVWSGTDQYHSGKYIADHEFDPNAVDRQLGCAGLIMAMRKLDSSIRFADEPMIPDIEHVPLPKPKPTIAAKPAATVAATTAAVAAAHHFQLPWWSIVLAGAAVAAVVYLVIHKLTKKG